MDPTWLALASWSGARGEVSNLHEGYCAGSSTTISCRTFQNYGTGETSMERRSVQVPAISIYGQLLAPPRGEGTQALRFLREGAHAGAGPRAYERLQVGIRGKDQLEAI